MPNFLPFDFHSHFFGHSKTEWGASQTESQLGVEVQKKLGVVTSPQLKETTLNLASLGKIAGVDSATMNLLVFNNMKHERIVPDGAGMTRAVRLRLFRIQNARLH